MKYKTIEMLNEKLKALDGEIEFDTTDRYGTNYRAGLDRALKAKKFVNEFKDFFELKISKGVY